MRLIREFPFPILIVLAVLMLGAPFVPEPHLVEKARMAMNGTLTRPIDLFDVVWHLLPTALLVWKIVLWRRERAAGKDPSPIDSSR
ncbi:MAG: hypothetical protein R6W97_11605 [Thiobacillus sp.]